MAARSLLVKAAAGNHWENVTLLLAKGLEVDSRDPDSALTPLMGAAAGNADDTGALLLSKGARLDLADPGGNTALWFAAGSEGKLLGMLLSRGLKVGQANLNGGTPLMHAAESCAAANVRALLAAGANSRLTDKAGRTALALVPIGQGSQVPYCEATRRALGVR